MIKYLACSIFLLFPCSCATDDNSISQLNEAVNQSPKFKGKLIGPENYIVFKASEVIQKAKTQSQFRKILEVTLEQISNVSQKDGAWSGEDGEIFLEKLIQIFHKIPEKLLCERLSINDEKTNKLRQVLKIMIEGRTSIPGLEKILIETPAATFPAFLNSDS